MVTDKRKVRGTKTLLRPIFSLPILFSIATGKTGCEFISLSAYYYFFNINYLIYFHLAKPQVRLSSGPIHARVGQNITLPKCHVTGFPKPVVSWKRLTGALAKKRAVYNQQDLTVIDVQKNDTGPYECRARNHLGEAFAVTTLFVWSAPKFVTKPPDMATNGVGGSVSLNCSAIGETVPLISWKRAAGAWDEKRMKVDKGTLTISVLRESDSGIYVCEAKGPQFTIEARTSLKVKG